MSDSTGGDFDFTGAVFGAGDDSGGFGDAGPSSFFGAPSAGGMGTAPLSIFGADSATSAAPAMGAAASPGTPPPPMPVPGAATPGAATVPTAGPAPPVPVTPAPQAPGFVQQLQNWLQGKTTPPAAGAPGTGIGGASGAAGTPTPAGVDAGSWDDPTSTGGSGQSGDLAAKLKTALGGLQGIAKAAQPAANPYTLPGWPLGRPPGFGAAPQSKGAQSQGLADLVQTMQQRQAQLQGQYMQGTYQPRYTGGLLGV
jgi:hypothetical protein